MSDNVPMIMNFILASICGAGIFVVYYLTYTKVSVSRSFAYTLILLPPVSCMVATGISNDIVFAAGMLGSLSIIRFRHSMKEAKDLVFIFWAVTAGITSGLSLKRITVIWCFIVGVITLGIHFVSERRSHISVAVRTNGSAEGIESVFSEFALTFDLKYEKVDENSDLLYECRYKKKTGKGAVTTICERIMQVEGVTSVKFIEM